MILAPRYVNRLMWRNSVFTQNTLKFVKTDLHICGLDLEKLSDLPKHLSKLLDVKLEVTKKTKGDNENIYFNRRIVNDRTPEQVPAGGRRRPCPVLARRRSRSSSTRASRNRTRSIPGWWPRCAARCRPGITRWRAWRAGRGGAEDAGRFRLHGHPQPGALPARTCRSWPATGRPASWSRRACWKFCRAATGAAPTRTRCSAARSSIILDYRIPVFFCSSRQAACQFVQAYLLGRAREVECMTKAATAEVRCFPPRRRGDGLLLRARRSPPGASGRRTASSSTSPARCSPGRTMRFGWKASGPTIRSTGGSSRPSAWATTWRWTPTGWRTSWRTTRT